MGEIQDLNNSLSSSGTTKTSAEGINSDSTISGGNWSGNTYTGLGELDHHFGNGSFNAEELTLQPGEWVTLAAKSSFGGASYVTGSLNTREDQ